MATYVISWSFYNKALQKSNLKSGSIPVKVAAYLKLIYYVEHFLRKTNLLGYHYFAYGGCYNYPIITVLNNYHMFSSSCAQTFFKKS